MRTPRSPLVRFALPLLAAAAALAGCGLPPTTAEEPGSGAVEIGPGQSLEVETWNGRIEVTACAGSRVEASWVRIGAGATEAEARADLAKVEAVLERTPTGVRLVGRRRDGASPGGSGVRLRACVPPGTPVRARSGNGAMTFDVPGAALSATASNGSIHASHASGPVRLETSNGSVRVEGTGLRLDLRTSNGRVTVEGSLAAGEHHLATSNGRIEVLLPADAAFALRARTSNGHVACDFPLTPPLAGRPASAEGVTVPGAPARLDLETSNGAIEVRRKP